MWRHNSDDAFISYQSAIIGPPTTALSLGLYDGHVYIVPFITYTLILYIYICNRNKCADSIVAALFGYYCDKGSR